MLRCDYVERFHVHTQQDPIQEKREEVRFFVTVTKIGYREVERERG